MHLARQTWFLQYWSPTTLIPRAAEEYGKMQHFSLGHSSDGIPNAY
jgi:hypothetical protein